MRNGLMRSSPTVGAGLSRRVAGYGHHLVRLISLSGLLLLAPLPCRALEPDYLREWPDPQRVIQDIKGKDRMDTLARQSGALIRLRLIVKEMAGARYHTPGQYPTADERRIL